MDNRPRIIELVGVAGTGKSTLKEALRNRNGLIQALHPPPKHLYLPLLQKITLEWMPLYIMGNQCNRWFTKTELRNMGYLDTWIPYICAQAQFRNLTIVLDPGSVYWLSSLQGFGPDITKHPRYQYWWEKRFEQWAAVLDVIVWLEAPEELCLQRVLARNEWHEAKTQSRSQTLEEFGIYRKLYEKMISKMTSKHPIKIFYFRTNQISTEQMVDHLFSEINLD